MHIYPFVPATVTKALCSNSTKWCGEWQFKYEYKRESKTAHSQPRTLASVREVVICKWEYSWHYRLVPHATVN